MAATATVPPALPVFPARPRLPRHAAPAGTVVVLHAHPDDEAIFTGATLRALADRGSRVVVVTATSGEEGVPRARLADGESLGQRRVAELERACELLGVARLAMLGYADSGAHAGPWPAGSLGAAPVAEVAARVAAIVEQEQADALVHYDRRGIYGHVDHVQVHRAGALAARHLAARGVQVTAYEATVDADRLRRGPRHVLQQAAGDDLDAVERADAIDVTVRADASALLAKMAAMTAHASQIGPQWLDHAGFGEAYGQEWFIRRGRAGVLDSLARDLAG
jgi:LmbE family N-acetylglucosaminyl deacetylase